LPFAVVFVPLLGLHFSVHRAYVRIAAALFAVSAIIALGAYGQVMGGVAFGLVIALHASGIAAYLDHTAPADSFVYRLGRRFLLLGGVGLLLSVTTARIMERIVVPVTGPTSVLLINPHAQTHDLLPGETVAYNLDAIRVSQVRITAGLYLGRVLALPGSEIEFTPSHYRVDGIAHPSLPHMPSSGKVTVEAGRSFIWPSVFLFSGDPGTRSFPLSGGLVADSALVGRPYKRWFWRTQTP
jgi:hypothetical protein